MTNDQQRAVEAVARAMFAAEYPKASEAGQQLSENGMRHYRCLAQAALAAARPLLFEEAAGIVREAITCGGVGVRGFEEICTKAAEKALAKAAIRTAASKTDAD